MSDETMGNDQESLPLGQVPVGKAKNRALERGRIKFGKRLDKDPPQVYPNASWDLKPETEARLREHLSKGNGRETER